MQSRALVVGVSLLSACPEGGGSAGGSSEGSTGVGPGTITTSGATTVALPDDSGPGAYWKSVEWPAEGLFIGEPLARPWDGSTAEMVGEDLVITTNLLIPGVLYDVEAADASEGPWEHVLTGMVPYTATLELAIEGADRPWYRLVPQG